MPPRSECAGWYNEGTVPCGLVLVGTEPSRFPCSSSSRRYLVVRWAALGRTDGRIRRRCAHPACRNVRSELSWGSSSSCRCSDASRVECSCMPAEAPVSQVVQFAIHARPLCAVVWACMAAQAAHGRVATTGSSRCRRPARGQLAGRAQWHGVGDTVFVQWSLMLMLMLMLLARRSRRET